MELINIWEANQKECAYITFQDLKKQIQMATQKITDIDIKIKVAGLEKKNNL